MEEQQQVDSPELTENIAMMTVKDIKNLSANYAQVVHFVFDTTSSVAIIFPDEEISRVIDKSVFDIDAQAIKDKTQDKFPALLKQFENKKFTIVLAINKTNLEEGSNVYDALEIMDKIESGASHDPARESNVSIDYVSTVDLKSENADTPNTGVSSTKTRRKNLETIVYDDQIVAPVAKERKLAKKKGNAMHAYIPAKCDYDMERKLRLGTVNIIRNFTVQAYKDTDKFRCLRNDMQMVFTQDTTVQQIEETGTNIAQEAFDFYDHSELMPLTAQTTYLADNLNLTHVASTKFYLNYNHHSVQQIRQMLSNKEFAKQVQATEKRKPAQLMSVQQIKELTEQHIGRQRQSQKNEGKAKPSALQKK
ncbi:hypothetical protein ACET3Z_010652 [Daucus carota]